jgi:MFS family permease
LDNFSGNTGGLDSGAEFVHLARILNMCVRSPAMPQSAPLTHATLRTPRAAAIAGVIFSVLQILIFWLLRISVPADPLEAGAWLKTNADLVVLALNLIPFAGIAFLWFIGVLRDRLGPREDRFFATVFFGSALLFLAMLFVAAAAIGAIILAAAAVADPNEVIGSATLHFARAFAYNITNVYAIKMAGVFMISTSTIAISTRFAPRWIAVLGYILALTLLLGSYYISWSFIVFPAWVLLISLHIVIDNFRRSPQVGASRTTTG